MLVILPLSKRGEIKISMILPYNPRDIIKVIINTLATNVAFLVISFIYLFFGFEKARDLYLSKLRFEKLAKILGLKELIIIFFEDKQRFKFIFDCNTLDLIHLLLEAERDVLKLSKALVKEDSVIIDVGAYRGGYTVRFAKKAIKGKVIAIEPNSENYKFLLLNIYYNNVKNVIVYKTIAYSHRAKIKFFENKDVPAMSRVVTDNSNSIEIEAITLDEISKSIKLKKIGLIKIDAESSEYEILKGSEYTLKLTKYLIIEVSTDLKQIFDFLEERDEFKILFVGYNFIDKGGLMAIKTFRKVRERIKSAKLIIVSKRNPPEINCESIEFLGSLENKILREKVMPSCDIFLAPFLGKPSAASLLEAMAAGLPVIATFIPLYLDYVIDGKTGYLVKEYNEETFTKIIIDLIENKRALNGMQENCIKHIKNNYDPAIISKKLYDLYKRLC